MKRFYTYFILLCLFLGFTQVVNAQDEATWMPDANLRTAVRSALNINAGDALTQADMADLTSLTARDSQISDVTGLNHATNLTQLDLRSNSISSITALAGLTKLTHLWLAFNSVTDISSLSGLTELTFLTIRDNTIGSISDLSNLQKLAVLWIKNCGITDVSPLTGLTSLQTLRIADNTLTNAHLLSSLTNLDVDITIPDPPDTTSPTVSIAAPSGVQNGAFTATLTFSESVSDFVQGDVSLSGTATATITSWSANSANTVYTATITPTTSGTVLIDIAADVATDAASNGNTAATQQTVTVDLIDPTVTITVPTGTQNGAFAATITFSKVVSDFVQGDVSLSGTATASITAFSTNDNTVYTATITPTTSGTVILNIAASVATDGAGNNNTAAAQQTVTADLTDPTVSISVPTGTQAGAFAATLTFSEAVSDFVQGDVSLSGTATASITSFSTSDNTTFTATITPTTSGTVILNVAASVATDGAGNNNTAAAQQTVTVDLTDPTVSISVPTGTQAGVFDATITFSKPVSDFVQEDVSLSGTATASITNWSSNAANTAYVATITPTTSGTVILNVAADVATDGAGNGNTAAPQQTVTADLTDPTVSISVPSGTQTAAFNATITFSEAVSNFVQGDVSLSGTATASVTSFTTSDNTAYTATITPTSNGAVTIGVAADVATDAAGNSNTAATSVNVTVAVVASVQNRNTNAPTVSISVPSVAQNGAFAATITFSESVSDFVQGDVSLSGTATASITAFSTSDNTVFTATITPTTGGTIVIDIAADVATDGDSNGNTAATQQTVTVDLTDPTVSISAPSSIQNGAFTATITFSESVSDFVQGDVSLSGTATASITSFSTSDNTVFTATITPTTSGTVILNVAASVATDGAGNDNTAATQQTVTVDLTATTVSISVPSVAQNGAFTATITFSESVSDFVQGDVSLSGTATATITSFSTSDNTVFTATITPTTGGTVIIDIAADVATDGASNGNTAATQQTVTVDFSHPTVRLSVPTGTQVGAFAVTITFSEAVSDFVQGDVVLSGTATASITAFSTSDNTVFTATITPTTSGTVILDIAADVATDSASNGNTAATQQTVYVDIGPPGVSISSGRPVNGRFSIRIAFSESVSDFVQGDVVLSGTATASITDWFPNSYDPLYYSADVTATTEGTVIVDIAADVATDSAGNGNTAATQQTYTVDLTVPTVSISVPTTAQSGAFDATITFSETVSRFKQDDVVLSGTATASITSWSANAADTVYTATITPTRGGVVTIGVAAGVTNDAAGNDNTAATSVNVTSTFVDTTAPTVQITGPTSDVTTYETSVTITFSERVYNFEVGDITMTSDTASVTLTLDTDKASEGIYTAKLIAANVSGSVTISIAAGVANDFSNNSNTASDSFTLTFDVLPPSIEISQYADEGDNNFTLYVNFSNEVTGFEAEGTPTTGMFGHQTFYIDESTTNSEIQVTGGVLTLPIIWPNYRNIQQMRFKVTATSDTFTISIAADVAQDKHGRGNTAATLTISNIDYISPYIASIDTPDTPQTGGFEVTLNYSEPIERFRLDLFNDDSSNLPTVDAARIDANDRKKVILTIERSEGYWPVTRTFSLGRVGSGVAYDFARNSSLRQSQSTEPAMPANSISVVKVIPHDLDKDGDVDLEDVKIVVRAMGQTGAGITDPITDIDADGDVDKDDAIAVIDNVTTISGAPANADIFADITPDISNGLDRTLIAETLDAVRLESDGSLKYLQAIALLEYILAAMRPDETLLLVNYPNPFNPETWIPYHLANASNVEISIYDMQGRLVRRLALGHQVPGHYTSRGRAAYWDGRNGVGERVASGVYFYRLQADNMSLLRKMVILK